jgi:hypothetical protein
MFHLKVTPSMVCPTIYPYCAAAGTPEIYMHVAYNPNVMSIDNLNNGIEHNFDCTASVDHCLPYGSIDGLLLNSIIEGGAYNYAVLKCS